MYTREKKLAAVLLYIKYDCSPAAVLHELGYPDRKTLLKWYREYLLAPETSFTNGPNGWPLKYAAEQRQAAVKHYLEHGRCLARTIRAIGYPS
jgi:putative transposase